MSKVKFDELYNIINKIDDACIEHTGLSLGACVRGSYHYLDIEFSARLWNQDDADVCECTSVSDFMIVELQGLKKRIDLAIKTLKDES